VSLVTRKGESVTALLTVACVGVWVFGCNALSANDHDDDDDVFYLFLQNLFFLLKQKIGRAGGMPNSFEFLGFSVKV